MENTSTFEESVIFFYYKGYLTTYGVRCKRVNVLLPSVLNYGGKKISMSFAIHDMIVNGDTVLSNK